MKTICAWERVTVLRGDEPVRYEAELYVQPVSDYVIGRVVDAAWWKIVEWAPRARPEYDSKTLGWRLRFELWATYERPNRHRKHVACVPLTNEQGDRESSLSGR